MMTLQELVQMAAHLYPARRAVCFDACSSQTPVTYTYKTVVEVAMNLTDFLRKHCTVTGSSEVGLYCYPGINLPSWIIGILQLPAAYSVIDPDALPNLSAHFMKKCNFQYVLVDKDQVNKFTVAHGHLFSHNSLEVQNVGLFFFKKRERDVDAKRLAEHKDNNDKICAVATIMEAHALDQHLSKSSEELLDIRQKHSIAYILHTSGTTGLPKIVKVPHKCIVPNIVHLRDVFKITPDDTVFLASPLTFDPSVIELFIALSSGASLLIVPQQIKMMPQKLSEVLFQRHSVSVVQATPTLLRRFGVQCIKSTVLSAHSSLRILALGGEAFPGLNVLRSWKEKGNKTHIFNIYGITEVSCWATCYKVPEEFFSADHRFDLLVPLGAPLLGTTVEVKDANGSAILEGEGQVFIGGKERVCFLDDEVTLPMGTMRATGDFVRVKDTEMFFLGRKDNQIKRHGKRLDIQQVQQIVEGHSEVESCALIWYQEKKLILFVVPKGILERRHFLNKLQKCLPGHAVPDELLLIEILPFTSHGKIDVSELNKVYSDHLSSRRNKRKLSRKELWEGLQYLWKSLLNLPDDSSSILKDSLFLHSGGDSLKSLQFQEEIEYMVGRAVPSLLEVILSRSFEEVYQHVLKTVFPSDGLQLSCHGAVKRKLSESSTEDCSAKCVEPKSERSLSAKPDPVGFMAVNRGNRLFSVNALLKNQSNPEQGEDSAILKSMHDVTATNSAYVTELDSFGTPPVQENLGRTAEKWTLNIRWRSDLGKCVDASPLVVISTADKLSAFVYIGSHSHIIQAIDLYSGKVKWMRTLRDRIESSACISKCGNFIIVGCYHGFIYVLRSSDGEVHWTFKTEDAVKSSPAVDHSTGLVFIGSHDQHVYALDIYKEECVWKLHSEAGAVFSSPHLSLLPHQLYIGTLGGLLLAINPPSLSILTVCACRMRSEGVQKVEKVTLLDYEIQQPVAIAIFTLFQPLSIDLNVVTTSYTPFFDAEDLPCSKSSKVTGNRIWKHFCGKPIFSSPHCDKNYVFVGCVDGNLYCFNHSGEKVWQFSSNGPIFSSPCVSSCASEIFFGSHDCCVYCCNKEGQLVWKFETTSAVYATPFVFHSHDSEDKTLLAVVSTDGRIWILNTKTGFVEGTEKLPGEVFSSPVVWGSAIVVGCRNNFVYCLDICISKTNKTA